MQVYKRSPKGSIKRGSNKPKINSPTLSKKSIEEFGLSTVYNLVQDLRVPKKKRKKKRKKFLSYRAKIFSLFFCSVYAISLIKRGGKQKPKRSIGRKSSQDYEYAREGQGVKIK